MIYLDTTLFVHAALDTGSKGSIARECFSAMDASSERVALTSLLTFDELVYAVKKRKGRASAVRAGEALFSANITLCDVNNAIVGSALHFLRHEEINPRDALHVATMKVHDLKEIVSDDSDFDRIHGLKRISAQQFLEMMKKKPRG